MTVPNQIPTVLTPEEAIQQLRAMRELIPDFAGLKAGEPVRLSPNASLHPDFLRGAILAIDTVAPLTAMVTTPPAELLAELDLTERWSAMLAELDSLRSGIIGAIGTRRYRLGLTAREVYHVSQQLAKTKQYATLRPLVETMKRAARFGGRRRAAEKPEPPAAE
ncbi:MAG TPA: hypothetical protein VF618_21430 [Thermoanaerobaculia bacterium]